MIIRTGTSITSIRQPKVYAITSIRLTRRILLGCTKPCMRKWRLRDLDFLVNK